MSTPTLEAPTVQIRGHRYPVVLPKLRDARMHIAAVTITLHVLGQTVLGFRVSVPQILVAILAPAVIEFVRTFRRTGSIVWPASAMLTGSGVALIFRVVGTAPGDHWTWTGWHLFAAVSVGSLLTKYLITHDGSHVFNPSNLGLVVAFLLLGSGRVEPLDFWWAPLRPGMVAAYLVIIAGGILITRRLRLLEMGAVFWIVFTAGLALLAVSGHCMTAAWSPQPVCGTRFWWTVATSPEVAIFLFFMITDPKTVPARRRSRVIFAVAVAVVSLLLIAPQTTEFGAKVGLLAGLTVMSPIRYAIDRTVGAHGLGLLQVNDWEGHPLRVPALIRRGAAAGGGAVLIAGLLLAAGIPARPVEAVVPQLPTVAVSVDPATLPVPVVGPELEDVLGDGTAEELAVMLAENLEIERTAAESGDQRLLLAADSGIRRADMERAIDLAVSDGIRKFTGYRLDSMAMHLMERDGSQIGAGVVVDATGVATDITTDAMGAELDRSVFDFEWSFVLRQGSDGRWLIDSVQTPD